VPIHKKPVLSRSVACTAFWGNPSSIVMCLKRIDGFASKEKAIEEKNIVTKSKEIKGKVNCVFIFLYNLILLKK